MLKLLFTGYFWLVTFPEGVFYFVFVSTCSTVIVGWWIGNSFIMFILTYFLFYMQLQIDESCFSIKFRYILALYVY